VSQLLTRYHYFFTDPKRIAVAGIDAQIVGRAFERALPQLQTLLV
jgi:hypothetical protein